MAHALLIVTQSLYVIFEKLNRICCKPQRSQQRRSPVIKKSLFLQSKGVNVIWWFKVSSAQQIKADFFCLFCFIGPGEQQAATLATDQGRASLS